MVPPRGVGRVEGLVPESLRGEERKERDEKENPSLEKWF